MKRTCRRRTFAQIRAEQRREDAAFVEAHAVKLVAAGQVDEAAPLRAVAGMLRAGFAETESKGR